MKNIDNDDLRQASKLEQLGDEAASQGLPAATAYLASQRLLLPVGVVWTDREAYAARREAFDRLQQKLYGLEGSGRPRTAQAVPREQSEAAAAPGPDVVCETSAPDAGLSVWNLQPGMHLRVMRTFRDYDGQEIQAGEILHFLGSSYFFYDGGHSLYFEGKTIRLADVVEEHQAIIANTRQLDSARHLRLGTPISLLAYGAQTII